MTRKRAPAGERPAARTVTADLVRDALSFIPPDVDRDTWARVAMAVKAADLPGAAAFELWDEWSARGQSYNKTAARDTWRSVKAGGAVTVGTLFGIAKDHGFRFPEPGAASAGDTCTSPEADRLAMKKREERALEEARFRERADAAVRVAQAMWVDALPAGESAYLRRKGVGAHGVKFFEDGTVLVPLRDAAGELRNVQRIAPRPPVDGKPEKSFLPGGRKSGLWHLVGDLDGATVLLVGEGYATCATLHEATGRPVAVAFDAGNLVKVVPALRELYPALPLLVCGDNDHETEAKTGSNPGAEKARSAARAGATELGRTRVVLPAFEGQSGTGRSDFNDLAALAGPEAVRTVIEAACAALLAGEDDPGQAPRARRASKSAAGGPIDRADSAETGSGGAGGPGGPAGNDDTTAPAGDGLPGQRDWFTLDDEGVWHRGRDRHGNELNPLWLCAPLRVTARTRADDANGWGYLMEFADPDGNPKTWAAPTAMFSGEGAEWAARLRDMGLRMAPGTAARNLVGQYIETRNPEARVTQVERVGWHGPVYVLPSGCIGSAEGRRYVFQSEAAVEDSFRRRGTVEQWRDHVAALARGNSRLVFAIAVAFVGPALRLAGAEGGGYNLKSDSSNGKTTTLLTAASVWGRSSFMKSWRTTANALEGMAAQHSDCTLILDEVGQMPGAEIGEAAYLLANGQSKVRSTGRGVNRRTLTWRLAFLSSGEMTLADHMAEAGKVVRAGQEVRMADVPMDAGAGMGGIEFLHDHESPASLVDAIRDAAETYYGSAGRAWLEWLCEHHAQMPARLEELTERYKADMVPEAASEQVRRVGARFALVAAAGELATSGAGLTGWPEGHALWAVRKCFNAWLAARGHLDNGEEVAMFRQVRAWLEKNGDALLTWVHRALDDHRASTPLRAGFKRLVDDQGKPLKFDAATEYIERRSTEESGEMWHAQVEYLILPEAFRREVCKGFDSHAVARMLKNRGHLRHESDRLTNQQRLPGIGKAPCFHIKASIMSDVW